MDAYVDAGVEAALWGLDAAFVAHPAPRTLEGCPHCHDDVAVRDADPLTLALALGDTLGGPQDVRALTPWMLRHALTGDRVDLRTVLARVAAYWEDWTVIEQDAVRDLADAVFSALLDTHPDTSDGTDGATAAAMLDSIGGLGEHPDRLLSIWEYKDTASADHHLAELVVDAHYGLRVHPDVLIWAHAAPQRDRLHRALRRDRGRRWAGTLAAACDLLPAHGSDRPPAEP